MASHSAEGTEDRSIFFPYFRLSSESQTQVLISYKAGYLGQTDTPNKAFAPSARAVVISDFSSVAVRRCAKAAADADADFSGPLRDFPFSRRRDSHDTRVDILNACAPVCLCRLDKVLNDRPDAPCEVSVGITTLDLFVL